VGCNSYVGRGCDIQETIILGNDSYTNEASRALSRKKGEVVLGIGETPLTSPSLPLSQDAVIVLCCFPSGDYSPLPLFPQKKDTQHTPPWNFLTEDQALIAKNFSAIEFMVDLQQFGSRRRLHGTLPGVIWRWWPEMYYRICLKVK
jgi:hypothetical protein